ncbi:MAG: DUF3466 family protein, partial [Acidobacteriales bacterium]|nr:DUF3466 family protein [Terriglobales bacterium]
MKLSQRSLIACICAGMLAPALHCRGQCPASYSVEVFAGPDCPILPSWAGAFGISDDGAICGGYVDCGENGHQVIWSATGEIAAEIPPSAEPGFPNAPLDLNIFGEAVGRLYLPALTPPDRAFLYSEGVTINLGALPGHTWSEALAINSSGIVVGNSNNSAFGPLTAFMWEEDTMSALPLPYGTKSEAYGISDSGQICGWMGNHAQNDTHAYIYDLKSGEVIDVGTPLPGTTNARATGINNADVICGWSFIPCGFACYERKSFIWNNGAVEDLGVLPEYISTFAQAINDANVIVGYCDRYPIDASQQAFVWQNGVIHALNDLVAPELNLNIRIAWDINNAGQIVASATQTGSSDQLAVRLTPIPSPTG